MKLDIKSTTRPWLEVAPITLATFASRVVNTARDPNLRS